MTVDIAPLKLTSNEDFLEAIYLDASSDYQRRITPASKAGVQNQLKQLTEYSPAWNEFQDALINRIGGVMIRNTSWTNPLAQFKRGMLTYGNTIEEIKTGLIKAKGYDTDRESLERELFGRAPLEVETNFHTVNRMDKYKISVNPDLLQRAFLDEGGLSQFISETLSAPTTSDQWDEFLLTCALFPEYESNGGFFKINVPDVAADSSTEQDAKTVLRRMRAAAGNLKFISDRYNAARFPTSAQPSELLIFCTPEFNSAIDVEALAGAFNIEKANMYGRVIEIPKEQFGIDGAQAIMTTSDFFIIADQKLENTSMYNPSDLHTNYWLHHWQVISASRFIPALLFTTKAGDEVIEVETPVVSVTAIVVEDRDGNTVTNVTRGEIYSLTASAVTSPANGVNDGVRWSITGNTSNRTYVTQNGVLHVGGMEGGTALVVTATSTWLDDENLYRDGKTATVTLTPVGASGPEWPEVDAITGITIKGVAVPAFVAGTHTYTVAVPGGTVTAADVVVTGTEVDDLVITVNSAGTVVTIEADTVPGDPVYTVTVTAA